MMTQRFENKVVAITGATSGIGLETLQRFVAEGAKVLAIDRDGVAGLELQQQFNGQVHFVRCDVTKVDELKAAIDTAESHFGGLDILFNNAGSGGSRQTADTFDLQGWDDTQALEFIHRVLQVDDVILETLTSGQATVVIDGLKK